jgi:hypothetical protein
MSWPRNSTAPDLGGGAWMIERASVDFPDPVSPTTPRVSPG